MATEKTNEAVEVTQQEKAMLKKVAELMPGAKVFAPRPGGSYYGPVVFAGKNYIAQQVGENSVVAHPRWADGRRTVLQEVSGGRKGDVVSIAWDKSGDWAGLTMADPERWKEREAREPASPEHTAAARQALGEKFGVYYPPAADKGLSPRYDGVVAGVTETALIQRVNSRTAIVHEVGAEVAKQYGTGQEVSVSYDNGKLAQVAEIERPKAPERSEGQQPGQAQEQSARSPNEAERKRSWAIARNLVNKSIGEQAKIYAADRVNDKDGKFRGPIVAVTDHHAIQRVGKGNSFIAHNRQSLEGERLQTGRFMQINYDNGKAQVQAVERRRPAQEQEQAAPQRPAPSRSQGMSR